MMTLFNVIVYETNAIKLQVEAEDDIEAARLVEEDINKYPVISEEVVDWNVDFVEEDTSYDVESCIIRGEDYSDCIDRLVESMEDSSQWQPYNSLRV